jgi:hypothetical protein
MARGDHIILASRIRRPNESWFNAIRRASSMMRIQRGRYQTLVVTQPVLRNNTQQLRTTRARGNLQRFLQRSLLNNQAQFNAFLESIRDPRLDIEFETHRARRLFEIWNRFPNIEDIAISNNDPMKLIIYYMRNLELSSGDIDIILILIERRMREAQRAGYSDGSVVLVQLEGEKNKRDKSYRQKHNFDAFRMRDFDRFRTFLRRFHDNYSGQNDNYTFDINQIRIKVIREISGGCVDRTKAPKQLKINGLKISEVRSSNNNCFFYSIKKYLNMKLTKNSCNKMREDVFLGKNEKISPTHALILYDKYKKHDDVGLLILDNMTGEYVGNKKEKNITIMLKNEHYHMIKGDVIGVELKCLKCGRRYKYHHKCNRTRVSYYENVVLKKKRTLIFSKIKKTENTQDRVIHYDIETYANKDGINEVTVVGYTDILDGHKFKYVTSMDKFVEIVLDICSRMPLKKEKKKSKKVKKKPKKGRKKSKERVFLNAYNGSNFDHYEFYKSFMKVVCKKSDKLMINSGSIINMEYKNLKLIDLNKHIPNSLDHNLKSYNCNVQKGEFDYDKDECLKYLKSDVLGLRELYNKMNTSVYEKYKVNLSSYLSTSHMTYSIWKTRTKKVEDIVLPTLEQETAFRKAVRGGRCYKTKNQFFSSQREAFLSGEVKFDDIDDYLIEADVNSLYPQAMRYDFPIGECRETKKWIEGKMGIYYIKYIPNKNLTHSIGGRRCENTGKLIWDLKESEGWYCSVDMEDMKKYGYKIDVIKGYYWEKSEPVFKEYIEELYEDKKNAKKGTAQYGLAKLLMNSLYGKTIQRPIYNVSSWVSNNYQFWEFYRDNIVNNIQQIGDRWRVTGKPINIVGLEKRITKPSHLGAFILAYSRRVMLQYIQKSNKYFGTTDVKSAIDNDIYYTDTDSIAIHGKNRIPFDKELGGVSDDLGSDCKILRGIWIRPKCYMLEYVERGSNELHYHFRGAGLNKKDLSVGAYEWMSKGRSISTMREFQFKKVHLNRNSNQKNIPYFSVVKREALDTQKLYNQVQWNGRLFIDGNNSVPFGNILDRN